MRRCIMSFFLLAGVGACSGSNRRNSDCEWPRETAISLDLRNPSQLQHLSDDALLAEDLAIRYADVHWGQRTGHFAGAGIYMAKRDACMAALFSTIAKNHEVSMQQVRESLARRRLSFDVAVLLSFAALYWFLADRLARRVCRRFPVRESPAAMLSASQNLPQLVRSCSLMRRDRLPGALPVLMDLLEAAGPTLRPNPAAHALWR